MPKLVYPDTRRDDVIDEYHGVRVPDPYRWLEDADSPETAAWVKAQNELTFAFLEKIPARARIRERLTQLWDHPRWGLPTRRGERWFYQKNDGLQDQPVLYVTPRLDEDGRVLLDPNRLSPDGTVALGGLALSDDGRLLAYGLSHSGSDWQTWRIRDVESARDRLDELRWVKFSNASFTRDGAGLFYSRYDEPTPGAELAQANYFQKLYYHRIGTPQAEDTLVYHRDDEPEWGFAGEVTEDGRYLVVTVWKGTDHKNQVFFAPLEPGRPPTPDDVRPLVTTFADEFAFLGNEGPIFWFKTDRDAPRGRIVALDAREGPNAPLHELIPQADEALVGASVVGDTFVLTYLRDAHTVVRLHSLDGAYLRDVDLPGLGTAHGFAGRRRDRETFYAFTSFTTPQAIYRYDLETFRSTLFRAPRVDFDPDAFETTQVFARSRDGTRVPVFVSHKKGLSRDGARPTYLYGYGGFNVSLTPAFDPAALVWMEMGGVFAVANLRGGGEYGEDWHQAGTRLRKQNVFDDFFAAAEWLIDAGYTRPDKLAIGGASNGGLLVGACMTQRPELFGAALPSVGVLDMLRFHKFTIGWAWIDDYGCSDNPEEFRALLAYSPYHNVREGTRYPATLVTTADHDDRVVPGHSFKFTAALQRAQAGDAPILIRIDVKAGHGAGKPTSMILEAAADRWAFLVEVLAMDLPEDFGATRTKRTTRTS